MRALLSIALTLLAFVLGTGAPSEAVALQASTGTYTHTYDSHEPGALLIHPNTERGPPAPASTIPTAPDAVDRRSDDASACPHGTARGVIADYNQRPKLARVADVRTTTAEVSQGAHMALACSIHSQAAAKALPAFPKALTGGPANVHVYYGVRDGKNVYVGITNNIGRRTTQHADRFVPRPITTEPLTRGQARAVEEALILGNPGFENKIHSISPSHSYYDDAVSWGQAWLRQNGL